MLSLAPTLGARARGFSPVSLFANGEKGVILLPEYSDAAVGSGVSTVTDISGNGKNATQGTAASQPILRRNATTGALYWEFDGSNDWLQTAAIDFTATDEITVFVALQKNSDAARGMAVELGSSSLQAFQLNAPYAASPSYQFASRGNAGPAEAIYTNALAAAPNKAVLTGLGDISADSAILRRNGAQVASSAIDQGTGNFGNLALYVGRRGGATLPFSGDIYGVIVVGKLCIATEITPTESFLNRRIEAY